MIESALSSVKSAVGNVGEALSRVFANQVGYDIEAYCYLETALDRQSFITKEGGLATFLMISGVRGYADNEEANRALRGIYDGVKTAFRNGDHSIHMLFTQDPDSSEDYVRASMQGVFQTLKRLEIESLADLIESDIQAMARQIAPEWCFMMVMTHPGALSKDDIKRSQAERASFVQEHGVPRLLNSQNPYLIEMDLCNPHSALITTLTDTLRTRGVLVEALDPYEALGWVRREIDPEFTDQAWRPRLLLDLLDRKSAAQMMVAKPGDGSHLLPPPLGIQLAPRDHQIIPAEKFPGGELVKIGRRYFIPIVMEVAPEQIHDFETLLTRINGDLPFRMSLQVRRGGIETDQLKQIFLNVFGWMGRANREIKEAYDVLQREAREGVVVALRMSFVTWAEDLDVLARRQAVLTKILQGWGNPQVTSNVGDVYSAVSSSVPGFGRINCVPTVPAPLDEVVPMMPILRPASPWPVGSSFNFFASGKLFPMQEGSKLQDTWNDAFYAPPGSGKSVLMNCLLLAGLVSPGLTELPPVLVLDVGPSASGVVKLLQGALPAHKKHLASYIKLRMSEEFTVNPFDTLPGCREPIPEQAETLRELLMFLVTPEAVGDEPPPHPPAMSDKLAAALITEVYRYRGDSGRPKLYQPHQCPDVDKALLKYNIRIEGEISWWRIADRLISVGEEYLSSVAQRYAVPTLEDCITVLKSDVVQDIFNKVDDSIRTETTQTLVSAFHVAITSALREYPVLSGPTRFDLGEARVVVFDLNEVRHSRRQTGLMYLLTMMTGVRRFYARESEFEVMTRSAPEIYHPVHRKMCKLYGESLKTITFDEFHNTGGVPAIRSAVRVIQREGRKWGIKSKLASQLLDDYDDRMISLLTSVYVMKFGNYNDVKKAAKLFNLPDDTAEAMYRNLNGPPDVFAYYLTKKGRFSQFLRNYAGGVKLWALTTDADDMALREALERVMSAADARKLLADRFPSGNASAEFQRRRKMMSEHESDSAVDQIAADLIELWKGASALGGSQAGRAASNFVSPRRRAA